MVRLYLLGFTHDLKGVVFSQRRGAKTATFWVPIDAEFRRAIDKLDRARAQQERTGGNGSRVPDPDPDADGRRTKLPPVGRSQARSGMPASEIQQMLREGKSTKAVAQAAKTPLAWVERLAEPVLSERIGVVRLAQRAYMSRARLGQSGLQLGEAVRRNLEDRRAVTDPVDLDAAWDARATASGMWRVWVRFSYRGKRRSAEWDFRKGSRQIRPRNRLAAQIGWWAPEAEPEVEPAEDADGDAPDRAEEEKKLAPRRPKPRPRRRPAPKRTTRSRPKATKRAPARRKPRARRSPRRR